MDKQIQLHDPEPLGASSLKPTVEMIGRAISVRPAPRPSNIPNFVTVLALEMESAGQIFSFSIDERSAVFLEGALQSYRLFHASTEGGTLSPEALNPST